MFKLRRVGDGMKEEMVREAEGARKEQLQLTEHLSAERSSAAKWQQELSLQQTAKANLLDEVSCHLWKAGEREPHSGKRLGIAVAGALAMGRLCWRRAGK